LAQHRILLAMPCAQGLVKMAAARTLAEAAAALTRAGCQISVYMTGISDVVLSRNRLASQALAAGYSHILFIDSDTSFSPDIVMAMLKADKDVVGLIYTRRELDMPGLIELARAEPDLSADEVIAKIQTYVVRLLDHASFTNGLGLVAGLGMGGALIKTSVLQTLIDRGEVRRRYEKASERDRPPLWGFFDLVTEPDGLQLSEDYSFCARWRKLGGEVWGYAVPAVLHTGDFNYSGDFLVAKGVRVSD
jgi:hypothetical protein